MHGNVNKTIKRGCPQGSVLGPLLWNIQYDEIINRIQSRYPNTVAYADDMLIIIGADTTQDIANQELPIVFNG